MIAPFPHHYHVRVEGGSTGAVVSAAPRPEFRAGAPAEFGGRDDWWSPEHLLLSAAGLCLKTTFDAFAARARVPVLAYTSRVLGALDKTSAGLAFTSIAIEVEVVVAPEHGERAEELLQTAKKHCIVANALKAPVELIATVRPAVPAAAPASAARIICATRAPEPADSASRTLVSGRFRALFVAPALLE